MLAVMNEDYPKARTEPAEAISELLNYLLALLNIKVEENASEGFKMDNQMLLVGDLIRTEFGSLTIPEIKTAFKMYVSKQLPVKVFRILDCVSVGEVLNAFIDLRNESLRAYSEKKRTNREKLQLPQISESEKREVINQGIVRVFAEYKETGTIPEPCAHIFDELYERKVIRAASNEKEQAYYQRVYNKAEEEIKTELEAENINSPSDLRMVKDEMDKIRNFNSDKVIIRSKKLILADFFKKVIDTGLDINSLVEK